MHFRWSVVLRQRKLSLGLLRCAMTGPRAVCAGRSTGCNLGLPSRWMALCNQVLTGTNHQQLLAAAVCLLCHPCVSLGCCGFTLSESCDLCLHLSPAAAT
jgi:hypothetical protein